MAKPGFVTRLEQRPALGGMGCVTSQGAWVDGVVLMNGGVFTRTSKILFGNIIWLSFRWLSVMYSAYTLYGISRVC